MIVLLILNAAAAAFAAIFSIVAAIRPQIVPPNQDDRSPFLYAYTGRAVGLALLAIPVLLAGASPLAALAALALGLAQAGDAVAGLRVRSRQLAIGASLAALVHVASAVVIALTVM